jgi:hypothetical protein
MDSTGIPAYGEEEQSAYNGHFESAFYHPLLLFNSEGDCLVAKLRPSNVHSAERWEEVLLPEIEPQQKLGRQLAFRADAARPEGRFRLRPIVTARVPREGVADDLVFHLFLFVGLLRDPL